MDNPTNGRYCVYYKNDVWAKYSSIEDARKNVKSQIEQSIKEEISKIIDNAFISKIDQRDLVKFGDLVNFYILDTQENKKMALFDMILN